MGTGRAGREYRGSVPAGGAGVGRQQVGEGGVIKGLLSGAATSSISSRGEGATCRGGERG